MIEIGDKVGAVLSADEKQVRFLGWGIYQGQEIPPSGFMHDIGAKNPKILLDTGDVVWGYQCWWGGEDAVKQMIAGREIVDVKMED